MRLSVLAWRGLVDRPLRSALTASGVAIGVALVMATTITSQASAEAVERRALEAFGAADLRVRAFGDAGLSRESLVALEEIPAVELAAPVTERRLLLTTLPGPEEQIFNLAVIGVVPEHETALRRHRLAAGEFLDQGDTWGIVVGEDWADAHGLGVGDELLLTGSNEGTPPLRIIGLSSEHPLVSSTDGGFAYVNRAALDEGLQFESPISYIDLDLDPAQVVTVQQAIDEVVNEPFVVETVTDARAQLDRLERSFVGMTFIFGALALFVGASLVYNTLAMTLVERTREIGLLRAAGATTRQVMRLFLAQGIAIGALGSSAGVVLGVGLAVVMLRTGTDSGASNATLPISLGGAAFAFLLGAGVTLVASLGPALQAGRVTPVDALRPGTQPVRSVWARLRWLVVAEIVVAGAGAILYPMEKGAAPVSSILLVAGGLLAAVTVTAFLLKPIGRIIGWPFEKVFGAEGRIGRANLGRDHARSGLTVGALMVGLATIVALGAVADSARATGQRWVDSVLPGGFAIRSAVPLDVELYRPTMEATAGTSDASPVVNATATTLRDGHRVGVSVAGIDPTVFESSGSLLFVDGDRATVFDRLREGGAVVVPEPVARRDGLELGDMLVLETDIGETSLEVAGVIAYTLPARSPDGALLVSLDDARTEFGATGAALWVMVPNDEMPAEAYVWSVRATAASLAGEALTSRELVDELARSLDELVSFFDVLALVAVVVATLGIVNTLTVGVYERVREIAILRAHGMTAGQVRSMIVVEAAIMGAVGGLLAGVCGLLLAGLVVRLGATEDFGTGLSLPLPLLGGVVVLGTLVAAAAALYPARLASRLPIVTAVQYD